MPPSELNTTRTHKWFLSSPPVEWVSLQAKSLLINALRQGPIPQHVAFVMDGNRRFARRNQIETVEGHNMGFEALAKVPPLPRSLVAGLTECVRRSWKSVINQA